jgi:formylglycine-generating enzyme required for sulfatase activity
MELEAKNRPQSVAEWLKLLHPPVTASHIREDSKTIEVSLPQNKTPWYLKLFTPLLPDSPLPLTPFQFDVVTVDEYGKIINRRRLEAQYFIEKLAKDVNLEMVSIPGGTFMMGSPESEKGHHESESPQHKVTVPPFFMGKYPVTQAQWRVVAGLPQVNRSLEPNPSYFKGDNLPVEEILWYYDSEEFCARLSKSTGRNYRLPSESEWEYACRAGTTTPFHFGETLTTDLANYGGNNVYGKEPKGIYRKSTTEVGSSGFANSFGLYDMHGNIWEWCADTWHDNYTNAPNNGSPWIDENNKDIRLLRGGSWSNIPRYCRSAFHNGYYWGEWLLNYIGFRIACGVPRTQ